MAGYSGTPLPTKLGMLPGTCVYFDGGALDVPNITLATRLGKDCEVLVYPDAAGVRIWRPLAQRT